MELAGYQYWPLGSRVLAGEKFVHTLQVVGGGESASWRTENRLFLSP